MRTACTVIVLGLLVPAAFAQKKEQFEEMRRDISQILQNLTALQGSQDTKNGQVQEALRALQTDLGNLNSKLAVMGNQVDSSVKNAAGPITNVNNRLDEQSRSFQELRESILDMNTRMGKLDAKITDLQNSINLSRNPAAPPASNTNPTAVPPTTSSPGGGLAANTPNTPPPGMQADTSYTNAYRDYMGGQLDLAMSEFQDYLKYFPTTQFAPNAQYYVGDIYYRRNDYKNAVTAFDAVLEQYSDSGKTADAHYMKGLSLLKLNQRDAAAKEFREVVKRYPGTETAAKATQKLHELGLSSGTTAPHRRRKR
ncbi:MAG: tetratricopeptide repeat protein [Bryobacteraceae bacterium]